MAGCKTRALLPSAAIRSWVLILLVGLSCCSPGCTWLREARREQEQKTAEVNLTATDQGMTRGQLQQQLLRFVSRFLARNREQLTRMMAGLESPEIRVSARDRALRYARSAIVIACSPQPELNLLDMVVMVTLARSTLEEYWIPEVYGAHGMQLLKSLKESEADIWEIAGRVLAAEQQQELRRLIEQWRHEHPDQHFVAHVRFKSFELSERTQFSLHDIALPLTLLPEVDETTRALDELRLASERYLFFVQTLSPTVHEDAQLLLMEALTEPPVARFLEDTTQFRASSERFADASQQFANAVQELPAGLGQETRDILEEFTRDLESRETRIRGLLSDSHTAIDSTRELLEVLNRTVAAVDALTSKFVPAHDAAAPASADASRSFDINDYREAVLAVSQAAQHLDGALSSAHNLLSSPKWNERQALLQPTISDLGMASAQLVDHAFRKGVWLIVIFLGGLLAVLMAYNRAVSKRHVRTSEI